MNTASPLLPTYGFFIIFITALFLLQSTSTLANPRSQTVNILCSTVLEHNTTAFVPNFVATMQIISDQMRTGGFGVALAGKGPDANYGLAQCYGDLSLMDCVLCYAEARTVLPQCFPFNGGRIFLDGCFMRAENYSFYNEYKGPLDRAVCGNTSITTNSLFGQSARQAVGRAVDIAPNNGGYARVEVPVPGTSNLSVYLLAQCWKNLKRSSCTSCLQNASASILKCLPQSEARALNTGCFIRYSSVDFLNREVRAARFRGNIIAIVISVVSSIAVLVAGVVIGIYIWNNRYVKMKRKGSNDANKMGVLSDGREIAVKRLFFNNKHRAADFYNEVNIISSVEHKNLVRLLGCSCSGPESLLVYEFLPNKSLDRFIFDRDRGRSLNWEKRFDIIVGTVEGLAYLHENSKTKIIHRDIKASNILLDSKFRAKIADFGLARSFEEDVSHISTAIAGTLGYMAPEYLAHGQLTEKADVYSFGVVLLETITGIQNSRSKTSDYLESIVLITWKHFESGTVEGIYDPNLMVDEKEGGGSIKEEILRVVHIGLLCTQETASLRPTMSKVLQMLMKKEDKLPAPTNPPFMDERTMELNDTSDAPSQYNVTEASRPSSSSAAAAASLFRIKQANGTPDSMAIQLVYACKYVLFSVLAILLLHLNSAVGKPRDQTVKVICGKEVEHNTTAYVPNFFGSMEKVRQQITTSGFGTAGTGIGPDASYGLAQCHEDLSSHECVLCHSQARTVLPQCFPFNGGRAFIDGCFLRFENYSFFDEYKGPEDTAVCGNLTQNDPNYRRAARDAVMQVVNGAPGNKGFAKAQVAVPGMAKESAVYALGQCWRSLGHSSCSSCLKIASASMLQQCLPRLEGRALYTGCFMRYSNTDFLNKHIKDSSKGGTITAGIIISILSSVVVMIIVAGTLPDGREIAVKRFFFDNRHRAADFFNEVNMISSVEHKNLVRLLGCSCSGPESLLVYEFLPNKSLDRFIFGANNSKALDWDKRYNIIIGTVEGLIYLHENPENKIIHRDIKASNILLDLKLQAKIADFGLARSFQENKSHISTAIAGTLGYMAPEYLAYGQLTEKVDVYSFGVLLLEIVTGFQYSGIQVSGNIESLVTAMWRHFQAGTVERLFDSNLNLRNHYNKKVKDEVLRVVHIGLLCIQEVPSLRPTMSKVLRMLTMEEEEHLPPPTKPPFMDEMTMELDGSCKDSQYCSITEGSYSTATVSHSSFHPR
ncbi:Cysteine-rich receptor-like protein kinase 2, partial [Cucurbita argyrosperma subsp. sororia]